MSDTNLTQLIVNHLTRDELHNADFTDHGNELFVQKDHAGVSVGGVGVDALDTTNITNCITRIPQDISIEVSSGHIILKSGSKSYFPNGSGVFDPYTTTADLDSGDVSGITTDYLFFINPTKTGIAGGQRANCYSGATEPTGANGVFWYDTTNNVVKRHNGSSWVSGYSLPVCVYGQNLVKKHIFNGFGFIGYTVFVLPGVKGLVPYYRNTDGTLKNTLVSTTTVSMYNVPTASNNYIYQLAYNGGIAPFYTHISYDETDNANVYSNGTRAAWGIIGHCSFSSGRISDFVVKQPFQSVDYSDTEYIAHQAMPSDRYVDLSSTTITDGMTLTAPADGYYSLYKASSAAGQMIGLLNAVSGLAVRSYASDTGETLGVIIPVSKGQTITVRNSAGGNTTYFRFIYANGSK